MAMIEKKNYWLRHIILIICVILILFPLVWLITTSIRRDNAAFSPKLFSSRVTLNNYKDLIIQKPNIPEVVNKLTAISSYLGEYSDLTIETASEKSTKLLGDLEAYFMATNKNLDDIEKTYMEIFSLYETQYKDQFYREMNAIREDDHNKFDQELKNIINIAKELGIEVQFSNLQQLIKQYFAQREKIIYSLKISNLEKTGDYYIDTVNVLLQIPLNTSVWKVKTYRRWISEEPEAEIIGEEILALGDLWKDIENEMDRLRKDISIQVTSLYGEALQKISDTENRINTIDTQISQILSQQNNLKQINQKIYTRLVAISDIFIMEKERVESAYSIFKKQDLRDIQGKEPLLGEDKFLYETVQKLSIIIPEVYNNLKSIDEFIQSGFVDTLDFYSDVYTFLNDNFTKIYEIKDTTAVSPVYKAIKTSTMKMSVSIDELVPLSQEYSNNTKELASLGLKLTSLREEKNILEAHLSELKKEYEELTYNISKIESIPKLLVLLEASSQEITDNFQATNYATFMQSKYYPYYIPERNRYIVMNWYNNLVESKSKFDAGREKLIALQNNIQKNIDIYKNDLEHYLSINYGGNVTTITPLAEMQTFYNTQYGVASADISRAGRIVSDLADRTSYGELKKMLRNIDKDLYLLQQDWSVKIRKPFMKWLLNSILVAGLVAVLTVFMTSIAAYPFSRMRFVGREQGLYFLLIIQMFPGVMFMIAIYGILKFMGDSFGVLGLDTMAGLIFAYMGGVAYNMWLFKGYYDTIPDSLEESAMIDGATRFQTFWRIVLPLSLPIIAVVLILTFMNTFNEFVIARIILQSETNYTYAVGLQTFSTGPYETEWGLFTAASLLGAVPMVILFLSMQKWIIGGLTQGSVKG
ncbi:MAG TPA: ABC transporter permease subunit [Defluviitoga sp.]|nr:ABC transporter permease subunit [Defluviitoga sp.]HOP24463.1 ABC transporter permease subunit [Defluviitoga sp.]HPZ28700.1 ABC transporter permease subunit [Defluviitoga sp.]HQD62702.1 ABC transporter permease subunit [Defluviitoga sp.]